MIREKQRVCNGMARKKWKVDIEMATKKWKKVMESRKWKQYCSGGIEQEVKDNR